MTYDSQPRRGPRPHADADRPRAAEVSPREPTGEVGDGEGAVEIESPSQGRIPTAKPDERAHDLLDSAPAGIPPERPDAKAPPEAAPEDAQEGGAQQASTGAVGRPSADAPPVSDLSQVT